MAAKSQTLEGIMKPPMRSIVLALCVVSVAVLSRCGGSHQTIPPLTITPSVLPNGTLGSFYSQTIQAGGGVAPFAWAVSAGTLPNNLIFAPGGGNTATISGTPDTAAQAVAFTIKITDSANQSATNGKLFFAYGETNCVSQANMLTVKLPHVHAVIKSQLLCQLSYAPANALLAGITA